MSERAKRAIAALREPDASLARVVNTVRQSIAEVIEHQQILVDVQAARIEALEAALRKHARHTSNCRYNGGHDCDCGLDEIRAALAPEQDK